MRQLFCLGRRISGHGAEALFDGACFDARCHIKCYFSSNIFASKTGANVGISRIPTFLPTFSLKKPEQMLELRRAHIIV